jgi:hypothetical protein
MKRSEHVRIDALSGPNHPPGRAAAPVTVRRLNPQYGVVGLLDIFWF